MSMPHTCRCGTCGYELSPMFITGLSNGTRPPLAAEPVGQMPWSYCPECGSDEIHHEEGRHKQCARCHQEWFSDLDYTNVVRSNLADKATLQSDLAQARERIAELHRNTHRIQKHGFADHEMLWNERCVDCGSFDSDLSAAACSNSTRDKLQADLTEAREALERVERKLASDSEAWIHDVADEHGSGPHDEDCRACEYTDLLNYIRAFLAKAKGAV